MFCFSYFWGILADKRGRKFTIVLSGSLISFCTIAFAFTNTHLGLAWAIATRLLSGASNGNPTKKIIQAMATKYTHHKES